MSRNQLTMSIQLTRLEVCDLLLACIAAEQNATDGGKKWDRLHNRIKAQLYHFDDQLDKYTQEVILQARI